MNRTVVIATSVSIFKDKIVKYLGRSGHVYNRTLDKSLSPWSSRLPKISWTLGGNSVKLIELNFFSPVE